MPLLVEIAGSQNVVWKDTPGVVWVRTAPVIFKDQEGSTTLRVSLLPEEKEHFWHAYISSFTAPQYSTAKAWGGFCELTFGQIHLSPEAFTGNWPPPIQCTIEVRHTETTEVASTLVFSGDIRRDTFDPEGVTYQIKGPKYTTRLLDIGPNYAGDTVPYPKAIGTVTHVEPLRVADVGGYPTYLLSGLATTAQAQVVIGFSSASAGTKTQVTTNSPHGWGNGTSVTLVGTTNFNGAHTIESASGSVFTIPVAFPTTNSEDLPLHASAYISGGFSVCDDGVPIQTNVTNITSTTFSLSSSPVGVVTMSGTAAQTTLLEVMTWGCTRMGLAGIISTNARGTSPDVSKWLDSQMFMTDFFTEICSFFTHFCPIKAGTLTLGDMLLDNGTATYTEDTYFRSSYGTRNAVSQIKAAWTSHEASMERVGEVTKAKYIKEVQNTVIESLYTVSSGTADGTGTKKLVDSGATFLTDGVLIGHVAQNSTDDTTAVVIAVAETALELDSDIFVSGETYVVGPSFPDGQAETVEPYHTTRANVSAALQNILKVVSKDVAEISIPISGTLPEPGMEITFSDTHTPSDMTIVINARNLTYDFDAHKIIATGEGTIS